MARGKVSLSDILVQTKAVEDGKLSAEEALIQLRKEAEPTLSAELIYMLVLEGKDEIGWELYATLNFGSSNNGRWMKLDELGMLLMATGCLNSERKAVKGRKCAPLDCYLAGSKVLDKDDFPDIDESAYHKGTDEEGRRIEAAGAARTALDWKSRADWAKSAAGKKHSKSSK